MRLQVKARMGIATVFSVLILAVSMVASGTLTRWVAAAEAATGEAEAERASRMVRLELEGLLRSSRDYAEWDDTVEYVEGTRPAYPEENWTPESLDNIQVDVVMLFDPTGALVGGTMLSDDGGAVLPPDPSLVSGAEDMIRVVGGDGQGETRLMDVRIVKDRPAFVVCLPVLPTAGAGSPRGTMLTIRWIDERLRGRLEEVLGYPVTLTSRADEPGFRPTRPGSEVHRRVVDAETMLVRTSVRDTAGSEVQGIELELERTSSRESRRVNWLMIGQLVAAGLAVGAAMSGLIHALVVGRLERLNADLRKVGTGGRLEARVGAEGDDEIGALGREINGMLADLGRAEAERENARHEREALQGKLLRAQKLEAVGEFAGGIAHDFNNCLTSIVGWLRLAMDELPDGHTCRENLAMADEAAAHATQVVKQLLTYSRQGIAALVPVRIGELLGESLVLLRSGLPKSIELRLHAEAADDRVLADRTQMLQVVMNLLSNARDAMGQSGTLTMTLAEARLPDPCWPFARELPAGGYLRLTVSDSGPGIPLELQERVFEPFFTTKPSGKGTGLGLSVVQSVVARHSGAVGVVSRLGEGATFHILLPLYTPVAEAPGPRPEAASELRVLLAEDDGNIIRVLQTAARKRNCTFVVGCDGEEAWREFERQTIPLDAVLTDLSMPRLGGMQLAERILASPRPVPIVLMTAFGSTLDPQQVRDAGFAAVLAKPMALDEVFSTLARVSAEGKAGAPRP